MVEKNKAAEVKVDEKQMQELEVTQKDLISQIHSVEIVSVETCQEAVDYIKDIKKQKKKAKDFLDFLVKPLKEQTKRVTALFKPFIDQMDQEESNLKSRIVVYQDEQEKVRKAEEEKLRKQQEAKYKKELAKAEKKEELPPAPPAPVHVEKPKIEGLQIRKTWKARIKDVNKIPRLFNGVELMVPDMVQAQKLVKAGVREIPGFEIYQETGSAVSQEKDDL